MGMRSLTTRMWSRGLEPNSFLQTQAVRASGGLMRTRTVCSGNTFLLSRLASCKWWLTPSTQPGIRRDGFSTNVPQHSFPTLPVAYHPPNVRKVSGSELRVSSSNVPYTRDSWRFQRSVCAVRVARRPRTMRRRGAEKPLYLPSASPSLRNSREILDRERFRRRIILCLSPAT